MHRRNVALLIAAVSLVFLTACGVDVDGDEGDADEQVAHHPETGVEEVPEPIELTVDEAVFTGWQAGSAITPATVAAAGGVGELRFSAVGLPAGVSLQEEGDVAVLSGVPEEAGQYDVTIMARGTAEPVDSFEITVTVAEPPPPLVNIPADAEWAVVGQPWVIPMIYSGGLAPFTYELENAPPGMTLHTEGIDPPFVGDFQIGLGGTPESAGHWEPKVTITDSTGQSLETTVPIEVLEHDPRMAPIGPGAGGGLHDDIPPGYIEKMYGAG